MPTIKAGNIRKHNYILFKNRPFQVTFTDFMSPGKGSAFMRVKLRDVKSGNVQEFTYKSTESVELLDVESTQMQFLYTDDTHAYFMNPRTYEQKMIVLSLLDDKDDLLTPDVKIYVLTLGDDALGVVLPPKVSLKVVGADHAVAGNTMGQAKKQVELETGLIVSAPIFVQKDDILVIDTETKTYISRA